MTPSRSGFALAFGFLAALPAQTAAELPAPAFDLDAAFAAAMPPAAEALWTCIPWQRSLTEAMALGKATGKPVYLYVNDGDVDSGRC